MKFITQDGSHSLFSPQIGEAYHSRHGAIQESQHVFLKMGLAPFLAERDEVKVLEVGLGTGLNALLTLLAAEETQKHIKYTAIEAFPINVETAKGLNYVELLNAGHFMQSFLDIHLCQWEEEQQISDQFRLKKLETRLEQLALFDQFDCIYFDAFAPNAQPELWTTAIFQKMYELCRPGGVLVTYCAKGDVRRNMLSAGFTVEKVPGPPGKREMLRAQKWS